MIRPCMCLLVLFVGALCDAQTASIAGVVTDSSGAVVSAAQIAVTATDTGALHTSVSNDAGTYSVTNLPVGKYRIEVTKQSFSVFRVTGVTLTVDQTITVNVVLQPGSATESVEVSATNLPPVDLESSQISNLVEQQQMVSLPLITRDPYSLILLSPGHRLRKMGWAASP